MSTLTIRLPDQKHARLRELAKHRDMSVNKLIEELATISLASSTRKIASASWRPVARQRKASPSLISWMRRSGANWRNSLDGRRRGFLLRKRSKLAALSRPLCGLLFPSSLPPNAPWPALVHLRSSLAAIRPVLATTLCCSVHG